MILDFAILLFMLVHMLDFGFFFLSFPYNLNMINCYSYVYSVTFIIVLSLSLSLSLFFFFLNITRLEFYMFRIFLKLRLLEHWHFLSRKIFVRTFS